VPAPAKAAGKAEADGDKQLIVKSGDTASRIAASIKSPSVSLDQMLVALLRSSPDAFIDNNINRIRAGSVLNVPGPEQAQAITPAEATRILAAQSKDFNAFRHSLATSVPVAAVGPADRKASGSIQAKVEEKKASGSAPDKLTLSKGAIKSRDEEAKIAKERADKEAAAKAAAITKNIDDLKKAGAAIAPAAPAPVAAPVPKAAEPAPAVAVAPPVAVPAPTPPSAAPAPAVKPAATPPAEEPGVFDAMLEDPVIPALGVGLLALLGGLAFYFIRQRKKNRAQVDSAFLESRLQPDSFFGASGGQRVDTNSSEGSLTGSSLVYSASQLDAADDVDPVAEADVYMAYGRDLQAEEILNEAVRTSPGRLAIHMKLLEIYAKRRDPQSFETTAAQAYKLTGSSTPEWARVCEMGLAIDPANPLYQPGGAPSAPGEATGGPTAPVSAFNQTLAQPTQSLPAHAPAGVDLDLDLDFSLDDEPASAISDVTGGNVSHAAADQTVKMSVPAMETSDGLDFDISGSAELAAEPELPEISMAMDGLSMAEGDATARPDFESTSTMPAAPVAPAAPVPSDSGMLEFDLGGLSLDLDPPAQEEPTQAPDSTSEDPLETKLALADEFVSIGDEDGARALIEEVLSEASGELRAKAQRALANLS
jgi:pilus assembly protein FimV